MQRLADALELRPGGPDTKIGGTNTLLSLVSRNYLTGVVRDLGGRFYVAGPDNNQVTVNPAPVVGQSNNPALIGMLTASNGLSEPAGLAFDSLLYVSNAGNGSITAFDVTTGATVTFTAKAVRTGLSAPLGLALNAAGTRLYVANRGGNTIVAFTVDKGNSYTSIPLAAPLPDLTGPIGIALHELPNVTSPTPIRLYVATTASTRTGTASPATQWASRPACRWRRVSDTTGAV